MVENVAFQSQIGLMVKDSRDYNTIKEIIFNLITPKYINKRKFTHDIFDKEIKKCYKESYEIICEEDECYYYMFLPKFYIFIDFNRRLDLNENAIYTSTNYSGDECGYTLLKNDELKETFGVSKDKIVTVQCYYQDIDMLKELSELMKFELTDDILDFDEYIMLHIGINNMTITKDPEIIYNDIVDIEDYMEIKNK